MSQIFQTLDNIVNIFPVDSYFTFFIKNEWKTDTIATCSDPLIKGEGETCVQFLQPQYKLVLSWTIKKENV